MIRMAQRLRTDDEDGFTLIELLIVIVILGILAGIAVFGVAQFQKDAKDSCDAANAKTKAVATAAYKAQNNGAEPSAAQLEPYLAEAGDCTP